MTVVVDVVVQQTPCLLKGAQSPGNSQLRVSVFHRVSAALRTRPLPQPTASSLVVESFFSFTFTRVVPRSMHTSSDDASPHLTEPAILTWPGSTATGRSEIGPLMPLDHSLYSSPSLHTVSIICLAEIQEECVLRMRMRHHKNKHMRHVHLAEGAERWPDH